jgi:hypothetical protein
MLMLSFAIARLALRAVRTAASEGGGGYTPALDFSDARNSQYTSLVF